MKRTLVTAATALGLVTGSVVTALPAQAAVSLTVTVTPSGYTAGSALESGARYSLVPYNAATSGVVGAPMTAAASKVELTNLSQVAFHRFQWLRCPNRGAAAANCTVASDAGLIAGSPSLKSTAFVPTQAELGGYLRARVLTYDIGRNQNGSFESPGASDVLVLPPLATGARPGLPATIASGADAQASLGAWNLPGGTTFSSRTVQAFTCPSADAGQSAAATTTVAGCTVVPAANVKTPVSTAAASVVTLAVPAATDVSHLVVQDTLFVRSAAGFVTAYQTRSAAGLIGVVAPTPTPTPTPSASASASAAPTPAPTPTIPANPSAVPMPNVLLVDGPATVKRGAKARVSVAIPTGADGLARVAIRSRPTSKGRLIAKTVSMDVVGGSGQTRIAIPRSATKGKAYIYAVFVNDATGERKVASRQIVIR